MKTSSSGRRFPVTTAPVIACAALLLIASSCAQRSEPSGGEMPGRVIFSSENCMLCHGESGEGTGRAPRLSKLSAHYSKEQLVQYLSDPGAYIAGDERLLSGQSAFSASMPKFGYLGEKSLTDLAEYLFTL